MNFNNLTSVIFNDVVNETQICYHLVYPKNFNLIKKLKRIPQTSSEKIASKAKRRRRGRPRKEEVKKFEEVRRVTEEGANDDKPDENTVQLACSRTRYGRLSRPPKHMSKFVDIKDPRASTVDANTAVSIDTNENQNNFDMEPCDGVEAAKILPEPKKVRKNVDRFTCAVCKKVYLGRKKMLKHYLAFPDHKSPIQDKNGTNQFQTNGLMVNGTNSLLFDELKKIVGRASQSERISIFLAEISNFVSKVRLIKPQIVHLEQVLHSPTSEYYVDRNVSKVLDLPEGLLHLNDRAFDNVQKDNNLFRTYIDDRSTTDIPSMGNLQQIGYNLNLFPQVNYDQISDNAVEAEALGESNGNENISDLPPESPILDIPLDLFSFNGIK